jgi:hypothetical protein
LELTRPARTPVVLSPLSSRGLLVWLWLRRSERATRVYSDLLQKMKSHISEQSFDELLKRLAGAIQAA